MAFNTVTGQLSGIPGIAHVGSYPNIRISVNDGNLAAELAPFTLTVAEPEPEPVNNPPTIAGSPNTTMTVGKVWSFTPVGQDSDGDNLSFSVLGAPSWMIFNTVTGQLSGIPGIAHVGNYPDIRISVSDGELVAELAAFSLTVTAPQPVTGSATLSWQSPSLNTDGSALTSISGYRIYYGRNSSNLEQVITVSSGITTYVIDNLEQGTWYFAIAAIDGEDVEGDHTDMVNKTIP